MKKNGVRSIAVGAMMLAMCWGAVVHADGSRDKHPAAWAELLKHSQEQKVGLEFYLRGQMIPGIVTAISDDGAVEVRNQVRDRIVIRLDRVDAIGR